MAKGSKDVDKHDTRVLYKKSMSTIRTHSRTCSIRTQLIPKSGIQNVKQNLLREHEYYNDGKKLKRDLSIETDICIMRNNIRTRKNKFSYQEVYSEKSKFSTFTIGDSLLVNDRFEAGNSKVGLQNTDVVSLIVDNFRALLNNWIREYLYDSTENLQKIEAIREALVKKLEQEVIRVSMSSGILNTTSQHTKWNRPRRRLRAHMPKDVNIFNCEVNYSNYTFPFQSNKYRKPNSSISKTIGKPGLICKGKNSLGTHLYKIKNQKNMFVSLQKPEVFKDSSTYIMLSMSSGSFKCCATRDETNTKKDIIPSNENLDVKNGAFIQEPIIRPCLGNLANNCCFPKTEYSNDTLVREVYGVASNEINIPISQETNSPSKNKKKSAKSTADSKSGTDRKKPFHKCNCYDKKQKKITKKSSNTSKDTSNKNGFAKIDDAKQNLNQPLENKDLELEKKQHQSKTVSKQELTSHTPEVDLDRIQQGHYTYMTKKSSNNKEASKALINHIQDIFSYFDTHDEHEEIRLDVHVNVLPVVRDETVEDEGAIPLDEAENVQHVCNCKHKKATTAKCGTCGNYYAVKCGPLETLPEFCETESLITKESESSESEKGQELISILDGATNNVKYIMMSENNSIVSENKECYEKNIDTTITNNQQSIYYEINSLKSIIKKLTITTEKIIEDNIREKKLNTLSSSTQVEFGPQYFAMINSLRRTQNENMPKNINNESYSLWFSQKTTNRTAVPEMMEQMINAELRNYEMSIERPLHPTVPDPIILCHPKIPTIKDSKPHVEKEEGYNIESKGIQFSYNFAHGKHCSGFKLQKVTKKTSYAPLKKPSFTYIESESIIKVTDMTSLGEMSHNDVGLSCPSYPPFHVQVYKEEDIRNTIISDQQNSDEVSSEEIETSYPSNIKKKHDPSPSHRINKDNASKSGRKHSDLKRNESMFIVLDEADQGDLKPSKILYSKFCKIGVYFFLFCALVVLVAMNIYYMYTKRQEIKPSTEMIAVIELNNTSDLPILLSDFGF